jgi:hypothetical protein
MRGSGNRKSNMDCRRKRTVIRIFGVLATMLLLILLATSQDANADTSATIKYSRAEIKNEVYHFFNRHPTAASFGILKEFPDWQRVVTYRVDFQGFTYGETILKDLSNLADRFGVSLRRADNLPDAEIDVIFIIYRSPLELVKTPRHKKYLSEEYVKYILRSRPENKINEDRDVQQLYKYGFTSSINIKEKKQSNRLLV